MKRVLFSLHLFLILVFTANISIAQTIKKAEANSGAKNSNSVTNDLTLRRWNLIEIKGLRVRRAAPFIEFNSAERRFIGNAGCNRMFGKFETSGRAIKLSGIGTTRMFCPAEGVMKLEADFIKALGQTTRFEQKNDELHFFAGKNLILKFSDAAKNSSGIANSKAVKLEDRKWILAAVAGKALPKAEKNAFLVFNGREASAGGDSGCNLYGGRYKIEGDKISITEIISTMRACVESERMNIERELFEGLRKTNRFEIKAGRLNLYQSDKLLLTFDGASEN